MCLNKITNRRPKKKTLTAWKIFYLRKLADGSIIYKGEFFGGEYEVERTYEAVLEPLNFYTRAGISNYTSGFHAFISIRGARAWSNSTTVIRKVRLWGVHTVGTQMGYKTVVASKMRILKGRANG